MILSLLLTALIQTPVLPTPQTPEPLPPGSPAYINRHGCVTTGESEPWPPAQQIPCEPIRGYPSMLSICIAGNAYRAGQYERAALFYKKALAQSKNEQWTRQGVDLVIRLPLSLAWYRSGRIAEAKDLWKSLVAHNPPDEATLAALSGHFKTAFVGFALNPPGYNANTMRDSGAQYNLQRGMNAAATGRFSDARTYLDYSLECTAEFVDPPLELGMIDIMQNRRTQAVADLVRVLEGGEADPPDTASILPAQYDAMHLLLRLL